MAMIEINKNPSRKELLWFGLLFMLFFGIIGGLSYWKSETPTVALYIWIIAATVACVYFILPPVRKPLYLAWMYAAFPIGFIISFLVMVLIFYAVVTPIGLILRFLRRDSLYRDFEPEAETYWTERGGASDVGRAFRQF